MRSGLFWLFLVLSVLAAAPVGAAWEPTPAEFVEISPPASPPVLMAARRTDEHLELLFEIKALKSGADDVSMTLGVAAERKLVLTDADAQATRRAGKARLLFQIPKGELIDRETQWVKLRIGASVSWAGGAFGGPLQRERLMHRSGAPHAGLADDPAEWEAFDILAHETMIADREHGIYVELEQPMAGKATVVIEDAQGRRIRNLLASEPLDKGPHRIRWDGRDEVGNVVKPQTYHWRAVHHPGIEPDYLFSFAAGGTGSWRTIGPDVSCFIAAASNKDFVFLAAPRADRGQSIVAFDTSGQFVRSFDPPPGTGVGTVDLAADTGFLYVAHDGYPRGHTIDRGNPKWRALQTLTVTRYDVTTGEAVAWPNGQVALPVSKLDLGPGSSHPKWDRGFNLGGIAHVGEKLYVSSRAEEAIIVIEESTGRILRRIKVDRPGPVAVFRSSVLSLELIAVSGTGIAHVDVLANEVHRMIYDLKIEPRGLTVDKTGQIFVTDGETHTVRVYDKHGMEAQQIGTPGGPYAGRYEPERLVNPAGLALAHDGRLWVTEQRWNPKRVSIWDPLAGEVEQERFGPAPFGAAGGGFDPADESSWIGLMCRWKVDFEKQAATPTHVLMPVAHLGGRFVAERYHTVRQDDRTYLIGIGKVTIISEQQADGSIRDVALIGSTRRLVEACGGNPPEALAPALRRAHRSRKPMDPAEPGHGVLWVDRNGDGRCQEDEFDFAVSADSFAGAPWGHAPSDLTLRVPAVRKGQHVLVNLKPTGFHGSGAPKYPDLDAAVAAAVPIDIDEQETETATDRFGNTVVNASPFMKSFTPFGEMLWRYPNHWRGVEGSADAPLPTPGQIQGALFFVGMTPFDGKSDVFVLSGNHGRFFLMTSDGLYLDEMFKDVRLGGKVDAYWIGGEAFGGYFSKAENSAEYYLQSGHRDYRIFRIDGLNEAERSKGVVKVSHRQMVAADNELRRAAARRRAAAGETPHATIPFLETSPDIDGMADDWSGGEVIEWSRPGKPPVEVRCGYDYRRLYLHFRVQDDSPWINKGEDFTALFKTGDCVDVKLGADPAADPTRTQPLPGDIRVLIAPREGDKPIAVVYRYRKLNATGGKTFKSAWREETVDEIKQAAFADVVVLRDEDGYVVEAALRLSELGLPRPEGARIRGDFGVIYGDAERRANVLRSYWANPATGLVDDAVGEVMMHPNLWGELTFQPRRR